MDRKIEPGREGFEKRGKRLDKGRTRGEDKCIDGERLEGGIIEEGEELKGERLEGKEES